MLSPYRVVDLSDERGIFCSYLLAQLGAEVIAVEPPGGSSARRVAPLDSNGTSVWWQAYSRGKQIREIDLETNAGRAALTALLQDADFLVESYSSADRARFGLGYEQLAATNPALICVSITAFGSSGPKADWPATDLTVWAASGAHALTGDADRAPVRISVPQAFLHAGADAAGAALLALQARHKSGLGQQVDVSAQQSSAQAALAANLTVPNNASPPAQRMAGGMASVLPFQGIWPCRDGYVTIALLLGPAFTEPNRRLLRWVHAAGHLSAEDAERNWGAEIADLVANPQRYFDMCKSVEQLTLQHTQHELFEQGLARGIYIAPTLTVAGLYDEQQFHARGYWQRVSVGGRNVRLPGAFAKFSDTPLQVPGAAGVTNRRTRVPESHGGTQHEDVSLPLAGLKVLDFMWVIAGPFFTRVLADYGATVIKVESTRRLEPARGHPPYKDGQQTLDHGMPFANFNTGKLGITVDPSNAVGREVILDLVRWADVVTESFASTAMAAWGLDYATLKQINPRLVMLSSSLMGQTGPRAQVPGYGNMAAAIAGFYEITGWPDRPPAGPYLAYTDGVAPRFMLMALLAALDQRRRTGVGQHIDVSQAEAAIHLLAPALLQFELDGRVWQRDGNRDLQVCPHGVFPVRGNDRWIAIACQDDAAWRALCALPGFRAGVALGADATLGAASARKAREDELEALISAWTRQQDAADLERRLIAAGISAHVVQNSAECWADPQLKARQHFVEVQHRAVGGVVVEGSRFQLSRTPAQFSRAHPELGEHNGQVLLDILGYDPDRVADVFAAGAME